MTCVDHIFSRLYFFLNGKHYYSNLLHYHTLHFVFISFPIRSIERYPSAPSGMMIFINIHMMSDAPCFSYLWVSKSSAATTTSVWCPWGIYLPAAAAAAYWSRGTSIIKTPHKLNDLLWFLFPLHITCCNNHYLYFTFFLMIDLSYQTLETIFLWVQFSLLTKGLSWISFHLTTKQHLRCLEGICENIGCKENDKRIKSAGCHFQNGPEHVILLWWASPW